MKKKDLGGEWRLSFFEECGKMPQNPAELASFPHQSIAANVPGNVELDLSREKILPNDIFYGENILSLRKYELFQWWYEKDFATPEWVHESGTQLVFEGLDCFAAIWLNGEKIGTSANAMISHTFDITEFLKPEGELNHIAVRLRSPINAVKEYPIEPYGEGGGYRNESLWARKPAHCYGWDIMPRAVSAGIWRPVFLKEKRSTEITSVFLDTDSLKNGNKKAVLDFHMDIRTNLPLKGFRVQLTGSCGASSFQEEWPLFFTHCGFTFPVDHPKLWWPRGYGEANLYRVKVKLIRGDTILSEADLTLGIRVIRLERSDLHTQEHPGKFGFVVNGERVFCRGSNWVPADAFHSRDAERIPKMFRQIDEMNCNILRCWGGNVYETHQFFNLCDSKGIMVWQDFSMACAMYPQQQAFFNIMREEAEHIVKELRQHPSLALWSGDNEIDSCTVEWNRIGIRRRAPGENKITREILPEAVRLYDSNREYIPSSPYYSEESWQYFLNHMEQYREGKSIDFIPEQHYYPHGKYFKDDEEFLKKPVFMSELGCLGFPGVNSLKKYIPPEKLKIPDKTEPVWRLHSTEPVPEFSSGYRVEFYLKQVGRLFGELPDRLEDFVLASQIAQAEGIKFMVELLRSRKGDTSGVIWWNIMDGWPQLSDALVDYYFNRKLAYHYLRRTHGPLTMIVCEPSSDSLEVVAVNDTLEEQHGTFRVWDADTLETVLEGKFFVGKNGKNSCGFLKRPKDPQKLFLLQWTSGEFSGCNHYLYGCPPFAFQNYKEKWLPKIAALDNSFHAEDIGK